MTKKFSIKKLVAGVLAAAMVVTALPVSGLNVKAAGSETLKVYRSYNPNSGEHLYTTDAAEQAMVVAQGRSDEGVKFLVPAASSTPVYRVYNENSGEHLLVPKGEAEGLAKIPGWNNEGIKMYSDDNKGVPIYRVYNPDPNAGAGAHLYTSKEEAAALVAIGWQWDNNGEPMIYGVNEEVKDELALESVEAATVNDNGANVVIAYFNRPVADITPSDIQIRDAASDQLYSVDKVVMSSDKKSATITLTGTDSAGAGSSTWWLQPLREYNMTVTSNGNKAEKTFIIPATYANATVVGIDSTKKQITVRGNGGGSSTISIPDSIEVDYFDLLGRDVTVKVDKDMVATKLTVDSQKVVYGGFAGKVDGAESYLLNPVDGQKYYLENDSNGAGTLWDTSAITKTSTGWSGWNWMTAVSEGDMFPYAKLCLNSNGTVKTAVLAFPRTSFLVDKVNGDNLVNGTSEQNLKDYTIIKDGKTVKISDVKADETVFVDTTNKFADVYTAKKEGALGNVYKDQFVFEGATYNFGGAQYVDGKLKACDADYMAALKKGGKNIAVYFNRAAQPAFITGTKGEVKTSSKTVILTKDVKTFNQSLNGYVRIAGYETDAKEVKSYDVDVAKLKSIKNNAGASFAIGEAIDDDDMPLTLQAKIPAKFAATGADLATNKTITVTYEDATTGVVDTVSHDRTNAYKPGVGNGTNLEADILAGEKVDLTFDEDGNIIGLAFADGEDIDKLDGTDVSTTGAFAAKTFKAGYKTINGYQLVDSTMIYIVNTAKETVTAVKYGEFPGTVTAITAKTNIQVYSADGVAKAVTVVAPAATVVGASDDGDVFRGVVSRYNRNTDGDKSAYLEVVVGTETKKYDKFADAAVATLVAGDVVDITPNKAGTMINKLTKIAPAKTDKYVLVKDQDKTFTVGGTAYGVAANTTTTIAKLTKDAQNNTIAVPISFSELNGTDKKVAVATIAGSNEAVDAIVMTDVAATATPGVTNNITFTANAAAGDVIADGTSGNYFANTAATDLTAKVASLGDGVGIASYAWYQMADADSVPELISGATTKKLDLTAALPNTKAAGQLYYVVVTDTTGAKHTSTKVTLQDEYAASATFTIGAMADLTTGSNTVALGSFALKNQYNKAFTTAGATVAMSNVKLEGASVTTGATTIATTGSATTADPSVCTVSHGATTYTIANGDAMTVTLTDTASGNTFAVTLSYNGTAWSAGTVTATLQ